MVLYMKKQCPVCTRIDSVKLLTFSTYYIIKCEDCSAKIILTKKYFSEIKVRQLLMPKVPERNKEYSDYDFN